MVCCFTAKKLGAKRTIARIRDPEYADELSHLQTDLDLDMIINPEQSVANEIVKLMEYPSAINVELFAKGRVELAEIKVLPSMPIAGMSLKDISKKIYPHILIGAILRDGEARIPDGESVVCADDLIYAVGSRERMFHFFTRLGLYAPKIKNIMIVGGGRIAYYLAKYLTAINIKVKIIEADPRRCETLAETLDDVLVLNGDGTDDRVLNEENLSGMSGFVALTNIDEENLIAALYAKRHGVPKVVAKINRIGYVDIIKDAGIDNIVSAKIITANYILQYVRGLANAMNNPVNTLYRIVDNLAEVIEFTADSNTKFLEIPLRKLKLQKNILIAALVRGNSIIIPHGNDFIKNKDKVILITKNLKLANLNDILAKSYEF
jgi:trk system potassium uptake protein TrkA